MFTSTKVIHTKRPFFQVSTVTQELRIGLWTVLGNGGVQSSSYLITRHVEPSRRECRVLVLDVWTGKYLVKMESLVHSGVRGCVGKSGLPVPPESGENK